VSEAKPPTWFIATTLFMLLISGAWTIASAFPSAFRSYSLTAITVGNLGFLLALLSSALGYVRGEAKPVWKRIMIYSFAFGIIFLMASIIMFSVSVVTRPASPVTFD
jgi:hypothetical protein